uniref:Inosine/uridine-preferring nucleoside hydrolase domain-containing protein n=1 Tax=Bombyx mori TaxID=7091 RepID=A0A8R2AFE0_BOMMO|nr:probable uridine nucleosidase 2 isoform X1 [Bombyx mori]
MHNYFWIVFCLSICCCVSATTNRPKYIIDNDAGGDDAMAIFIAILSEKYFDGPELIALTTGHGNTDEEQVTINNQQILKLAGRQDIPIYRGSAEALVSPFGNVWYYGLDGLGDNNDSYTDLFPPAEESAAFALIENSKKYEGSLSVVTIGTLTNIAVAMKYDPKFLDRLSHLYIGAGHLYSKEDPKPEFNALMDVEAYHVVMQKADPEKVTILPFSQARLHCNFSASWRKNVLGAIDTKIMKAQNKHERISLTKNVRWQSLDPAVISTFLKPDLVKEYKYAKNDIIMCGKNRGINTNEFVPKDEANVRVVYSIDINHCE